MIKIDRNGFLQLLDELGYYEDDRYDSPTAYLKLEHGITLDFHNKGYILLLDTKHKETIFRLKYSSLLTWGPAVTFNIYDT